MPQPGAKRRVFLPQNIAKTVVQPWKMGVAWGRSAPLGLYVPVAARLDAASHPSTEAATSQEHLTATEVMRFHVYYQH